MVCSSLIFGEKDCDITIIVTIIIYCGQCYKFISLNHKSYNHVLVFFFHLVQLSGLSKVILS